MTATITPPTTETGVGAPAGSGLAARPVWLVAAASTLAAAVVTPLVAAVAKAADVPLAVSSSSDTAAEVIPTPSFAIPVLMAGAIGIVLALAFDRWAKRPAWAFVVTTVVLTVVSFASPLMTENSTTATRVVLELAHVVAAAIVIPPIAARLARRPARG